MGREELIAKAKSILAEAYEAAAEMIVLYLDKHPGEKLQPLCKEIDPENWNALRVRVQRAQDDRKVNVDAGSERTRATDSSFRHAKSAISRADEEQLAEIEEALEQRKGHFVTAQDKRETDAAMSGISRSVRSFASLSIVQHIHQATEDLGEAVSKGGLTPESIAAIKDATTALVSAIEFAEQMAGVS